MISKNEIYKMNKKNRYFLVSLIFLLILTTIQLSGQTDTSGVKQLFEMDLSELMNQKVVTASKYSQSSSEAASSIGVITSDEIKNFGYKTLGEALNSQRGLYLSNDKNHLFIGSRGFGQVIDINNKVVIMIDGHIMNEVVFGSAYIGNELGINMNNVEKIEIIRGPGSSVYGTGAMYNIINVIMKKGAETDGLTVSAGTGSFGKNDLSAIYGKKIKKTDISVSGTGGIYNGEDYYFSELDAPETNNGLSVGMDWEKYIGLKADMTRDNFKLSAGFASRSKGIPTGAFNSNLTGDVKSSNERFYIESSYRKELKRNSSMLFRSYYDNYYNTGTYPSGDRNFIDKSGGQWAGAEIQYYLEAGKRNTITAGVEYKHSFGTYNKMPNFDTMNINQNLSFSIYSLYAQDQIKIVKNLNLTAGLRYDINSVFGQAASLRVALVYKYSTASSLKLLYGEAFRDANTDFGSEKIRAIELAWSHKLSEFFFGSFSLYRFLTYSPKGPAPPGDNVSPVPFSNEKVIGNGIEYEVKYKHAGSKNEAFLNVSLQRTINKDLDEIITNSPAVMVKSGYIFDISKYFNIVPEFFYETARKTLQGNNTGEIYLFNLGINTCKFLKYFEVSLKARNLLNRKYYYPAGNEYVQDVLVQDSRNIYLKLTARF